VKDICEYAGLTPFLFGKVTHLRFSEAGIVMKVSGDYLEGDFIGLTKQEILLKLHEPTQRILKESQLIYRYTAAGNSGNGSYKRREIYFDPAMKVATVVATMYYD